MTSPEVLSSPGRNTGGDFNSQPRTTTWGSAVSYMNLLGSTKDMGGLIRVGDGSDDVVRVRRKGRSTGSTQEATIGQISFSDQNFPGAVVTRTTLIDRVSRSEKRTGGQDLEITRIIPQSGPVLVYKRTFDSLREPPRHPLDLPSAGRDIEPLIMTGKEEAEFKGWLQEEVDRMISSARVEREDAKEGRIKRLFRFLVFGHAA